MKTQRIGIALVVILFFLNSWATDHQKPMDEWEALQISLKGVKSIHPRNGFDNPDAANSQNCNLDHSFGYYRPSYYPNSSRVGAFRYTIGRLR